MTTVQEAQALEPIKMKPERVTPQQWSVMCGWTNEHNYIAEVCYYNGAVVASILCKPEMGNDYVLELTVSRSGKVLASQVIRDQPHA